MNDPDYILEEEWLLQSYDKENEQWLDWVVSPFYALSERSALAMLGSWRQKERGIRFRLIHVEKTVVYA